MSTYPGGVDQDDVLGQGTVESSAFDNVGHAPHEDDAHVGMGVAKRKKNPLWLWIIGGLAAAAILTVGALLVLGSRGASVDDASFAQVAPGAPQPKMDVQPPTAVATDPSIASPAIQPADPINGSDVTIGDQAAPGMVAQDAATQPQAAAAAPAPVAAATPAPVAAATPVPAAQMSDAERLKRLEQRYEALSNDYDRLNARVRAGNVGVAKPRGDVRSGSKQKAASVPAPVVDAKVPGVQLKAVVDHNAWVQTESGDSVMVAPGDEIPGVGRVRSVDSETGTVRLSDGRVIR